MAKEKITKKEKGREPKELSKEDKQLELNVKKEVFVHSMPKRFLKVAPVIKQSKGVGVFIILGGGLILVLMSALVYYFVFKKAPNTLVVDKAPIATEESKTGDKKTDSEKEKKEESEKGTKIEPEEEKKVVVVKEEKSEKATTTEEVITTVDTINNATTTKKKISADIDNLPEKKLKKAKDSDDDGLLDMEEKLLLTKEDVKDSDGDGYEDLAEFMNFYNPAGTGNLMINDNIEKYLNNQYGYYLYYPKIWEIDNINGDTSVIFKASNNQFIQIIIQPNKSNQSLEEWYKEQFSVVRIEQKQKIYKKGWLAIESIDGLSTYLMNSESSDIYVVNYNIGLDNILYYENIYKMMIKSMEVSK